MATPEMTWTLGPHVPSTVSTVIGAVPLVGYRLPNGNGGLHRTVIGTVLSAAIPSGTYVWAEIDVANPVGGCVANHSWPAPRQHC